MYKVQSRLHIRENNVRGLRYDKAWIGVEELGDLGRYLESSGTVHCKVARPMTNQRGYGGQACLPKSKQIRDACAVGSR